MIKAAKRKLRLKVQTEGPGVFVILPFEVREVFGQARPKVKVTVNGESMRTTVAVYGGKSYLVCPRAFRQRAGFEAGDQISLTLESDTEPRVVEVPKDLAAALRKAKLRKAFDSLSYTRRREWVTALESAKAAETRKRRLQKLLTEL